MRARAKQSSKSKSRSRKAKITDRNPNQNQNKSPVSNSSRPQQVHFENRAVRGWQFEISKVSNESRGRFERDNTKNSRKFGNQQNKIPEELNNCVGIVSNIKQIISKVTGETLE